MEKSKSEIIKYAESIGAIKSGFAEVRVYEELLPILSKRGFVPFVKGDILKRVNPYLYLKSVKSILVCLFPYQKGNNKDVAKFLQGGDYHPYVKEKLRNISDFMGVHKHKILVDSGGLLDRYLAYLAGLGFYGLNNLFYTDGYGSRFYIGSILTDLYYTPDKPLQKSCLKCKRCLNVCEALNENYEFDYEKCYSYINQTNDCVINGYKTGCDLCSDICPLNCNN